jgi:hypothetical protein
MRPSATPAEAAAGHDGRVRILDRWAERSASRLGATAVFRPPVGAFVSAVWVLVTVLWLVVAAGDGWRAVLLQLPVMALAGSLVHATCARPLVAVGPDGVLLRNVVRDVSIPWAALDGVDTRYALTLTADGRRFAAWAAPAPSRFATARATATDLESVHWRAADGPIPASATLRSDAGAAAALIRRLWSPGAVRHGSAAVQIRWARGVVAALAVSAAATALAVALG